MNQGQIYICITVDANVYYRVLICADNYWFKALCMWLIWPYCWCTKT